MTEHEIMGCEEALRLLAAHLDGELEVPTRAEVDRHLALCRSCYSRAEFEKRLKARLAALGREPVRAEVSTRIHTMIRKFDLTGGP